jgi:hypothetical protein
MQGVVNGRGRTYLVLVFGEAAAKKGTKQARNQSEEPPVGENMEAAERDWESPRCKCDLQ